MRIEELIVELKNEIALVDFNDYDRVDDSFNWVNNLLDDIDNTDNTQLQRELRQILNDAEKYPLLQDSYFAMLDYLYKRG